MRNRIIVPPTTYTFTTCPFVGALCLIGIAVAMIGLSQVHPTVKANQANQVQTSQQ